MDLSKKKYFKAWTPRDLYDPTQALYADFETTTAKYSETESRVYLWGIKGATSKKMTWGIRIDTFFDSILQNNPVVYFHNLTFDGNFITKWLLENDYEFIDTTEEKANVEELSDNNPYYKPCWTWICDESGEIYKMVIWHKKKKITILCSYHILGLSVKNLGLKLGIEKKEIDYDEYKIFKTRYEVPSKVLEYLERDIDIVIQSMIEIQRNYQVKMTRSSIAQNDFIQKYGEVKFRTDFGGSYYVKGEGRVIENVITREEYDEIKKSYYGGLVIWNPKLKNQWIECKNGVSYDFNSLYPSRMLYDLMPYGKVMYTEPEGIEGVDYLSLYFISVKHAKLKQSNYPPFIRDCYKSAYDDDKYMSEVHNREIVVWENKLELIKKHYDIDYRVAKVYYFKCDFVYSSWVESLKHLKENATTEIEKHFHKGVLNGKYGKDGQHYRVGSRIIIYDPLEIDKDGQRISIRTQSPIRSNEIRYGKYNEYRHLIKYTENEELHYIPLASRITNNAQIELLNMIYANLDTWIYSDTDSGYFRDEPHSIDVHPTIFGKLKKEHTFKRFKVIRAKCYMYIDHNDVAHPKISGASEQGVKSISPENFNSGYVIKNGKKGKINVKGGLLIVERDFTI